MIVKVTKTRAHVRKVAVVNERRESLKGDWPVVVGDGDLSQPQGEMEIFRLCKDGTYRTPDGTRLILGRTSYRIDYSH